MNKLASHESTHLVAAAIIAAIEKWSIYVSNEDGRYAPQVIVVRDEHIKYKIPGTWYQLEEEIYLERFVSRDATCQIGFGHKNQVIVISVPRKNIGNSE